MEQIGKHKNLIIPFAIGFASAFLPSKYSFVLVIELVGSFLFVMLPGYFAYIQQNGSDTDSMFNPISRFKTYYRVKLSDNQLLVVRLAASLFAGALFGLAWRIS